MTANDRLRNLAMCELCIPFFLSPWGWWPTSVAGRLRSMAGFGSYSVAPLVVNEKRPPPAEIRQLDRGHGVCAMMCFEVCCACLDGGRVAPLIFAIRLSGAVDRECHLRSRSCGPFACCSSPGSDAFVVDAERGPPGGKLRAKRDATHASRCRPDAPVTVSGR